MARKKQEWTKAEITPELQDAFQEALGNKPSGSWPKINQGSHLTVKTFEDGRTELIWDDEALLRDVQDAINSVSTIDNTTPAKKTRKKKA